MTSLDLPHIKCFDQAFKKEQTTSPNKLVDFIVELLQMDNVTFVSKEWRFSEWWKNSAEDEKDCSDRR